MDVRHLVPWGRTKGAPAVPGMDEGGPFLNLHREINRLFEDAFRGFDLPSRRFGWPTTWPRVDVADDGKEVKVIAELPGMDENDVTVTLRDGVLTLRGEKKAENEGRDYSERWYGQFQRAFTLGPDIDPDKVAATFKNGVLTVTVEKKPEAQRAEKRIPING